MNDSAKREIIRRIKAEIIKEYPKAKTKYISFLINEFFVDFHQQIRQKKDIVILNQLIFKHRPYKREFIIDYSDRIS